MATQEKTEDATDKEVPKLDWEAPIAQIYGRMPNGAVYEQDGHQFDQNYKYLGEIGERTKIPHDESTIPAARDADHNYEAWSMKRLQDEVGKRYGSAMPPKVLHAALVAKLRSWDEAHK